VESESGAVGWVTALLPDDVEILLLNDKDVRPKDIFYQTGRHLTLPLGNFLLGRTINPLGEPIDEGRPLFTKDGAKDVYYPETLDVLAPNLGQRHFIDRQLDTGITVIDTLMPLGKGQRELVIGDPRSGKAGFVLDVLANLKDTGMICIYGIIGKSLPAMRSIIQAIEARGALPYTTIVAAASVDPAPLIFLTPQVVFTVAEFFQKQGKDVLVILNDMGVHAKIYREISLIAKRSPGRESYPGDIFYQHAHLMERGGNFTDDFGGGSVTVLPEIELDLNDFSSYIPTNLMGMTDGHLLFKAALLQQGYNPAIDTTLSVTRVGRQTQNRVQELLSTLVRQTLARAAQLETLSQFSFELPPETQALFKQAAQIKELLKQPPGVFVPKEVQTVMLALPFTKHLTEKDLEFVEKNKLALIEKIKGEPIIKDVFNFKDEQELIKSLDNFQF
jgi:F-type H+-transporting ATPase subunit alpha